MNSLIYPIQGDKYNSSWFNEYLIKLLEDRDSIGLTDMIRQVDALIINVEPGCSVSYVGELALMTPYNYLVTLESETYSTHVLRIDMSVPDILVREVRNPDYHGIFRSLNEVYPIGAFKPNARYMGEIFRVTNLHDVVEIQKSREIRFFSPEQMQDLELPANMAIVKPSPYTHNIVGYWERPEQNIRVYDLGVSVIRDDVNQAYINAKNIQKNLGIENLILPIDHLATRVYSQNREVAILEYLTLSSYYYWGSYDIHDQNSSTNVTKSIHYKDERNSPAKVFTAANNPYFLNHIVGLPSPTESFVRNYGPRLHHVALIVADGETNGIANIDYVVDVIRANGKDFLLDVIGSKDEGLKQIFSSASEHSSLIVEYVQRFGDFDGFFTKKNVAGLTAAAGVEENLKLMQAQASR